MEQRVISRDDELANKLREIYYYSTIKKDFYDESSLSTNICALVKQNLQNQKDIFNTDPQASHRISNSHELAKAFMDMYDKAIRKTEEFAYSINSRFGYGIDLSSFLCPYVLNQMGVTNENVSFYIGLGMILANIVCDSLANGEQTRREAKVEQELDELKKTCNELKEYVENSIQVNSNKELMKIQKELDNSIEAIVKAKTEE